MNDLGNKDLGLVLDGFISLIASRVAEQLQSQQRPATPQKEILTIDEVADFTGYAKATIYKYVGSKAIPFYHSEVKGSRLIFFRTEIESWLRGERLESDAEFISKKRTSIATKRRHERN